jgi:hypothetical protein
MRFCRHCSRRNLIGAPGPVRQTCTCRSSGRNSVLLRFACLARSRPSLPAPFRWLNSSLEGIGMAVMYIKYPFLIQP